MIVYILCDDKIIKKSEKRKKIKKKLKVLKIEQ